MDRPVGLIPVGHGISQMPVFGLLITILRQIQPDALLLVLNLLIFLGDA